MYKRQPDILRILVATTAKTTVAASRNKAKARLYQRMPVAEAKAAPGFVVEGVHTARAVPPELVALRCQSVRLSVGFCTKTAA